MVGVFLTTFPIIALLQTISIIDNTNGEISIDYHSNNTISMNYCTGNGVGMKFMVRISDPIIGNNLPIVSPFKLMLGII